MFLPYMFKPTAPTRLLSTAPIDADELMKMYYDLAGTKILED